jgi:hypothetical protein
MILIRREDTDNSGALPDIRYLDYHEDNKDGRLPNTGRWLIDGETYKEWKDNEAKSRLWLNGIRRTTTITPSNLTA